NSGQNAASGKREMRGYSAAWAARFRSIAAGTAGAEVAKVTDVAAGAIPDWVIGAKREAHADLVGASVQATDGPAGVAGRALLRRQPVAIGGEARAGRAKGVGRPVAAESVARGRAARPRAVGLTAAGPRVAPGAGPTLAIPGEAGAGAGRPAVGAREARVEAIAALRVARIARGAIRRVRAASGIGGRARRGGTAGHARR